MFSKIIVGTSRSEVSSKTLCCLQGLRQAGAREVILAHAMNIGGVAYEVIQHAETPVLVMKAKTSEDSANWSARKS